MDHTTDLDFSWECGREGHQHPSWDGAELCAKESDPQVEQLQKAVTKLTLSCMRALDALKLLLPPDHEKVKETYRTIHRQLAAQYLAAGEPYGHGETEMWRWLKERVD